MIYLRFVRIVGFIPQRAFNAMCMVRFHTWGLSYNQVSSFNHGHSSWFVRIVRILRASMVGEWGSSPQCPRIKNNKDGKNAKRKKL